MVTRPRFTRVCNVVAGRAQPPQDGDWQRPARAGQLGKNRQLIFIQFGRARIRHQNRMAHQTARVAGRGFGLAQQPLLAQHAGQ